jgi:hypothetical protein
MNEISCHSVLVCRLADRVEGSLSCDEEGERAYVGCYDSQLYCLHVLTGQILWSFSTKVNDSEHKVCQKI